jgi:hypothetical protein
MHSGRRARPHRPPQPQLQAPVLESQAGGRMPNLSAGGIYITLCTMWSGPYHRALPPCCARQAMLTRPALSKLPPQPRLLLASPRHAAVQGCILLSPAPHTQQSEMANALPSAALAERSPTHVRCTVIRHIARNLQHPSIQAMHTSPT